MRLRNIPESHDYFISSPYAAVEPEALRGRWRTLFAGDAAADHGGAPGNAGSPKTGTDPEKPRLEAEFGCGKGRFITELAAADPGTDYVGIDKYTSVLYKGLKRLEGRPFQENLRFACLYASTLEEIFAEGELDRIYLNFSDPWPKKRHADRRLTSRRFLAMYERILAPGGTLEFKTDNRDLFDFSLEELAEAGWALLAKTFDLHGFYAEHGMTAAGIEAADAGIAREPGDQAGKAGSGIAPDTDETVLLTRVRIMTEYEEKFSGMGNPICKLVACKNIACKL